MHIGPTALRGRRPRTTYLYDDEQNPDRCTGALGEPWFTLDDRALLLGLAAHEATLCPGCGQPKELAWHAAVQESWDSEDAVCHACTKKAGHQVAYSMLTTSVTDEDLLTLPPFVFGQTTTVPDPPSQR